jgi:hypothetical protein
MRGLVLVTCFRTDDPDLDIWSQEPTMKSRAHIGPLSALFIAALLAALPAVADVCPDVSSAVRIEVVAIPLEWRIDHDTTLMEINHGEIHDGMVNLGDTDAAIGADFDFEGKTLEHANGAGPCLTARVRVDLAVNPVVVRIGQELPVGSCLYEQVRAHEWRHVQVYEQFLASAPAQLRVVIESAERGGAGPDLPIRMQDAVAAWLKSENDAVHRAQAAIDTPEEYQRLTQACRTPG